MGLLDVFNSDEGRQSLALLSAAGPSATLMSFGQRMAGAVQQVQAQKDADQERMWRMDQMAQMKLRQQLELQAVQRAQEQQQRQQSFLESLPSPQMQATQAALAGGGGPTAANAAQMPQVDPQMLAAVRAGVVSYPEYVAATRKDNTPIKLEAGAALYQPGTMKQLALNPKEQDLPSAVREYMFAKQQGYAGSFQQFQLEQKRAGASSVSVSMDKGFGDTFAKQAAESLGASRDQAKAAANTISNLDRIDSILKGGNVAIGPGQQAEITVRQIAEKLGAGKDNAERLANTRELIQKASALAVDGAKMLAGQGQITEGERALVARAAGGDIDKLTAPEISALSGTLRKVNNTKLTQHQQLLSKVSSQFGAFAPFYQVDTPTPPEATPTAAARTVTRTGMHNGRKVIQYSDGTVEYAGN